MKKLLIGIIALLVIAFIASEVFLRNLPEAEFTVVQRHDEIELRTYAPHLVAEIFQEGERVPAIRQGFRVLADYIFGHNVGKQGSKEILKMTAPVFQTKVEKDPTKTHETEVWSVQFVLPKGPTLETAPKPADKRVRLLEVPTTHYVAIRFSGFVSQQNLAHHLERLQAYVEHAKLQTEGEPVFAFYNPPWTLPFLRRNEILLKLRKLP